MKIFYYSLNNKKLFSLTKQKNLKAAEGTDFFSGDNTIYFLGSLPLNKSRGSFCISDSSLLFAEKENLDLLKTPENKPAVPENLSLKISNRQVVYINTTYPKWRDLLDYTTPEKWKVNILALGDVGSTLLIGLKLLGGNTISRIGIHDRIPENQKRWEVEMNQVSLPFNNNLPEVEIVEYDDLFNCDMFVFCASKGVPPVGTSVKDVRMVQFEENAKIIREYAKLARKNNFKGRFSVVSDPVDQLCYTVFKESNTDDNGNWDNKGLFPEQIKGYGLGVMNARAIYYSKQDEKLKEYEHKGRAFGPHGKDLVIADNIYDYNNENSLKLTEQTVKANLAIRDLGYKPYIAPSLSSGAISLLATMTGQWHYSSNFIGGAYMGSKNRNLETGMELERIKMDKELEKRLLTTYNKLRDFNE
ncbi:Malate/lactate dehydrogenase [Dethiosulfatibacter aminovorans DSM 17477]|uniref:Malate/lactate dehydrogenase n=1 Tax=Dethiosulfatibacter aminovorans DSM 17477 TaxID=1121476 RepID=A0A1M6GRQ4_9FIRM|nr:lactate dehydrogenase [Dethiosulfatibacter aminovorans]SHJ12536.1 Malate/lactate dehydrogenase [Dethiosulfatibacter aminovorans DSM 17477]